MEYLVSPLHVKFPTALRKSDLFTYGKVGDTCQKRSIILEEEAPGGRITYHGPCLNHEHFALWKVIYMEAAIRGALAERENFEISDRELMAAAGVSKSDYGGQARIWELLNDLHNGHIGGETTRFKCPDGFGGFGGRLIWHDREGGKNSLYICFSVGCVIALGGYEVVQLPRPVVASREKKSQQHTPTPGFVYILTNPAMPGLIKIGKTRLAPADRAAQLHTTGVPAGFQVEYACRTPNPEAVEQAMHVAFGPTRLSHKREFFELSVEQAIAVLSLHHQDEAGQACA